ncbi:unnamed protein product, partial [Ixodes persulcatus]
MFPTILCKKAPSMSTWTQRTTRSVAPSSVRFTGPTTRSSGALCPTAPDRTCPCRRSRTLFAMSISLTALLLVAEKEEGLRDRCTVAGVTSMEVIIGHALVQMALAYMQTVFMLIVFVNVFDAPIRGSLLMCFVIPVTMAFCGMNFGFLTSSISKDEATALLLSLAALYPALLMGG